MRFPSEIRGPARITGKPQIEQFRTENGAVWIHARLRRVFLILERHTVFRHE